MITIIEDGGIPINESKEQFCKFLENEDFVHYVGMLVPPRPGVMEFVSLVENKHFKPGTPRNNLFIMRILRWSDIVWIVMSVPVKDKVITEAEADGCGLRIASGVPTIFSPDGVQIFPANNERIFTLENKPGHPVYRNDPKITKAMLDAELASSNGKKS